jgi:hypothetical protein
MENHKVRIQTAAFTLWCVCGAVLGLAPGLLRAACVPPPSGLIGWWKAEAGANDVRGIFPGAVQGDVSFTSGKVGQAFRFNGTNNWVQVPDANELSPHTGNSGELTLEAWVYFERVPKYDTATGQGNRAIAVKGNASNWEYGLYITTNMIPVFGSWQLNGNGYASAAPTNAITTNQWYHLAGVLRKGQSARLYLNGLLVAENTAFSGDTANGTSPFYIGRRGDGQWFDGLVDEVTLYGRALNAAEVAAVYAANADGKCPVSTGAAVPYFADFENGVGPEWSLSALNGDELAVFTRFSGRFNNTPQMLTLTNLVAGQVYRLGFDFYALDSWDGNGQSDTFGVRINGNAPWQYTFSNYNQEPPSSAQSFPGAPDEGRGALGFVVSYVDAIYRNIEIVFTASNSTTLISFAGLNVDGNLDDESWGIDNVSVALASATTTTFVRSTSLPAPASTNNLPLSYFTLSANWPLAVATATNGANYSLRAPGVDGVFATGDDLLLPMTATLPGGGGRSVLFTISGAPLQPGRYRFQTLAGLTGTNSVAVPAFSREFVIANPVLGAIESIGNDTTATATSLPITESPLGSGFSTAFAVGEFASTSDVDYWRFDAEGGDLLTVRLESEARGVNPNLYLQNAAGGNVFTTSGGAEGVAQLQNVTIVTPGTYYIRVWSTSNRSRYSLRFDQSRGIQMESEDNGSTTGANQVNLSFSAGLSQGKIVGSLPLADSAGDYFRLGTLNVGNSINVNVQYPSGSTLAARPPVLSIQLEGQGAVLASNAAGNLSFTIAASGLYYVRAESPNRDLRSQYLLNVTLGDGVPPVITSTSLPAEAATSTEIIDRFTLGFSEDLERSSVSNSATYELRSSGTDGVFNTADDQRYQVRTTGYTTGLSAGYYIPDGPLQPGDYRFTAGTNLADRAANTLAVPFVRNFTIGTLPGYVIKGRNNETSGTATPMAAITGTNGNGSVGWLSNAGAGSNPRSSATGFFNADTNLDLLVANFSSDSITSFTNDGRGNLVAVTNLPTGDGAISVAARDLNNDGKMDAVVANYYAGTVSILLGNGNGQFLNVTNLGGFASPYNIALNDLNADGKGDLLVPSYSGGYASVLLGNGDGTFQTRSNYVVGTNPQSVAAGDLNGDGRPDFAVANYGSSTVSIFTNGGAGTFLLATNLPSGPSPRFVVIADVNGDNKADLVIAQPGDDSVGVILGNGDSTFQPRRSYHSASADMYQLMVTDLNGDQRPDIVVPGYGNNVFSINLNNGSGTFTNLYAYEVNQNPIGGSSGDFNNDGRPDLVFTHYNGSYAAIWTGNPVSILAEDPPGSGLRTGMVRGRRVSSSDNDYYQFSANAGDRVQVAVDALNNPSSSSQYYQITELDGSAYASWYSDGDGWGQSGIVTLPYTGTYLVRVAPNHDYQGEYRVRVSLAAGTLDFESELNNSIAQSDPLDFARTPGRLRSSVAGYISAGDPGDFYNLGYLPGGDRVNFAVRRTTTSGLAPVITVYNAGGAVVTNSTAGVTNFGFTVPVDQPGVYHAYVTAASGGYATQSGTVLGLNGSSDNVDLGSWFNYQAFTLSFWVAPSTSQPAYADIFDNNHQAGINWVIQQDNSVVNQYVWGAGDGGPAITFNLAANSWQHIAVTRDLTNVSRVYINGVLAGTSIGTGQINYNGQQFLRIGRWGGGGRNWNGMIDNVRLWDRSLTVGEVVAGMTGTLNGNEPNLIGYWTFDEGFGSVAADKSLSNRSATLVGGPAWINLGPTNAAAPSLNAQYVLDVDLTNSVAPIITAVSLPIGLSTNQQNSFTVSFSEDMNPAFTTLARNAYKYEGRTYLLTDTAGTWWEAQRQAQVVGGNLASVLSSGEDSFLNARFSGVGSLWLGLNFFAYREGRAWVSGDPYGYSNFASGEPNNNSGDESVVRLYGNGDGRWGDISPWNSYRGVIEISSTADVDSDGLVDSLDPYPNDPKNAFDLRAAGLDGAFDTADDVVYRIYSTGYSSGLTATFFIYNGPLQDGVYRFLGTTAVQDRFGLNPAANFVQYFTNAAVAGFVSEQRRENGNNYTYTSLSANPSNRLDGSFGSYSSLSVPGNPHFILQGQFDADTNLDLVTANYNGDNISVLKGSGAATFQLTTNITVGNGPVGMVSADFNRDGKPDLAVSTYADHRIAILLGTGAGSFTLRTNLTGFSNPFVAAVADLNHDGLVDLVVPNYGGSTVSVRFGNGDGTFLTGVEYTVGAKPETVVLEDFNRDGEIDLATSDFTSATVSVLLGSNGVFQTRVAYACSAASRSLACADVNGDGKLDLVAVGDAILNVFPGNGDGSFQPRQDSDCGANDAYHLVLADLNSDGKLDAIIASYGGNRLLTAQGYGDGTFGSVLQYNPGGSPIAVAIGDYNRDQIPDIASANYSGNAVTIFVGNNFEGLTPDPAGTGLITGGGRGSLSQNGDLDHWTFSAEAGDRILLSIESPGYPGSASLLTRIYYPNGDQWTSFYTDGTGNIGNASLTAPISGTFRVRLEHNNTYYGEYRLRVTLAKPPIQLESEANNTLAQADPLTFDLNAGTRNASVIGYIEYGDGGDWFRLGNLAPNTQVTLNSRKPANSRLAQVMEVYDAASQLIARSRPLETNLVFIVGSTNGGAYYARMTSAYPSKPTGGTNGLYFDGDYVNLGAWGPTAKWAAQAWVMPASIPSGRRQIVGGANSCLDWGLVLQDGRFGINTRPPGGCGITYSGTAAAQPNTWYHLAAVCDGTNSFLYINGLLAATGPTDTNYLPYAGSARIGGNACCGEYFPGLIQEVSVWNRALAAGEIMQTMANNLTGSEAGLAGYWPMLEGVGTTVADASPNGRHGTLVNGPAWVALGHSAAIPYGVYQQYVLSINLVNTIPPQVLAVSLPPEGAATSSILDRFSATFSEDMDSLTVTNPANYELRNFGLDNTPGTADDQLYTVVNSPVYASGIAAGYLIPDGPLQPGSYRLTIRTNLANPVGSPLAANYVRNFAVTNLPGFRFETRGGNSWMAATSFSTNRNANPNGSFNSGATLATGSGTERIAAGLLNGDTNMDLVAALWQAGQVSVLTGNGDGTFTIKTNYTTGANAWSVALGKFNTDANLDLAVANHGAGTVTILSGNGDGTFQTLTNLAVGNKPYHVLAVDVNADNKLDLIVPNSGSGNFSLLLGNGNGTFLPATNYLAGTTPVYAAAGDVNGDGKPDLFIANYSDNDLMMRLGNGDGTFGQKLVIPTGVSPRAVVLSDLNNDSKLDLAVFNGDDNTISVMLGNGDGSFQPRVNYGLTSNDGYEIAAVDLNGDGWRDLVMPGYNNSRMNILVNKGNGTFNTPAVYSAGNRPVGLAVADFNNDNRLDIAFGNDGGNSVGVLLGWGSEPLGTDPATGLRIAAGRGVLYNGSQPDYWSFDAAAGDVLFAACDIVGNPSASGLRFLIYLPDGSYLTDFYGDYTGRGQLGTILPITGRYILRVDPNYSYGGEYRVRVTLAPSLVQTETEDNNAFSSANSLTYVQDGGHKSATVLAYLDSADPGDCFRLGTLSSNSVVNLVVRQPASSGFANLIEVLNAGGTVVGASSIGATNLVFTVPVGAEGAYFARARAVSGALPPAALHLTGSTNTLYYSGAGYAEIPINIPDTGCSISFWFRTADPNASLFSVSDGGGSYDRNVYLSGGNINARVYSAGAYGSSGLNLADSQWHHVVFSYGSVIGGSRLFTDGVEVASNTKTASDFTWDNRIRFGYGQDGANQYLAGYIDEARVFARAFTLADVQFNRTNVLSGNEPDLIGYWRFNEGAGTLSMDATTNGRNATLTGAAWSRQDEPGFRTVRGIFAQYLLGIDLLDVEAPLITAASIPAAGATSFGLVDRFSLNFNKELDVRLNGFNRDIRVYNGKAYTVTPAATTWYNAQQQARALGGHLVTINDALENTWIADNFGSYGNLWIGLNDELQASNFVWTSGEAFAFTNWNSAQPATANNQDFAALLPGGKWATFVGSDSYRGLIEVVGLDTDNDGIPDSLDPFPSDAYDGLDLRASGPDGLFDTSDDVVYQLRSGNYTGGLSLSLSIVDGPLQIGNYRFLVGSGFTDQFGNAMAPFVQYFSVSNVAGYVLEGRNDDTAATATPLPLIEDPPGFKTAAGRGNLFDTSDPDYWSFPGTAGDLLNLATWVPGFPGASQLRYRVLRPDGAQILDYYPSYNGDGQAPSVVLPVTGTYTLLVTYNYNFQGEYRFRITTLAPPMQYETEENASIATANLITWTVNTNGQTGSLAGRIQDVSDLDYYRLGTITNGSSIFLNVRLPGSSSLGPIVSVYNASGVYQPEAIGGRASDGLANVPITVSGTYYALVRSGNGTGGLNDQYLFDANVVPTGSVNFPNLVVTAVNPPSGSGIISGQNIVYSFTIGNVGNASSAVGNWIDRAVLSQDQTLGNADDVLLGFFPHTGVLNVGGEYSATNTYRLPDGISGDFYLIVQADAGNAVNEYLFKGDNVTVSTNTFHIDVAPYPDLVVEGLTVVGPDSTNRFNITWNIANRGGATAPAGYSEKLVIRNQSSGQVLVNQEQAQPNALAPSAILARSSSIVTTNPGLYQVQIVADSKNNIFEFNTNGNTAAEANNSAAATFEIVAYYNVTLQSIPPGAGLLTGAGTYSSGSTLTVTAKPVTNALPYYFVNWTEGGAFQSANTNYPFIVTRDRSLVANFSLPALQIAASNNPPAGGTVSGAGSYAFGTTNVLTANAAFGYYFTNWTEAGNIISTTASLTNVVVSNRFVVANYREANVRHVVTTGSSPTNVAVVSGAGTFTNGQVGTFTAPVSVTNPPNIFNFKQFTLNGGPAGSSASFTRTFSTLDPTNMQFVAIYDTVSILPLVTNVIASVVNPVPATTNFTLAFQFNRSMNTNVMPLVILTNPAISAPLQAVVPAGGIWTSAALTNDTFRTRAIAFGTGMDGTNSVFISLAQDLGGGLLARTNVRTVVVDVTPPSHPILTLVSSNNSSATVSWTTYAAPSDLNSFRVYLSTNSFTTVTGLTPVSSLGSSARSYTYGGLTLDRPYFVAVAAVDVAGNSLPGVTPLTFSLPSSLPPVVVAAVSPVGASSANVSWPAYNTSGLLGFAGFRVYYETTNFTSVAALTPKQVLGVSARSALFDNLDRTRTYYFAIVGFNVNTQFNAAVTTASWSDPYAGNIATSLTLGGAGQGVVDILQDMTVVNNAVVSIPAGTTVRFAPGKALTVQQGALVANGTALDPITFTSANDQPGLSPNAGDWKGILLGSASGNSSLRHVFVKFGAGLVVSNCAPAVDAFTALYNIPAGLTITNGASLNSTNMLLAYNGIGARQLGSGGLTIRGSVLKNNETNALALGGAAMNAQGNWWGSSVTADIDATIRGTVDRVSFLVSEPLLTPAIGTSNNVSQVGSPIVNLRLACRTADTMRLSEDSSFFAVFFTPFTNAALFALSAGGGEKTIFAQFRSITGQTSAPVALTINYITAGPAISGFNLTEGQVLTRPVRVSADAAAPLGMASMEFYVDNLGLSTNFGGAFSYWWDIRGFSVGTHRVRVIARDNSGNFATTEKNVTISPVPPSGPVITEPMADLVVNSNSIAIAGTAEPFIGIRLVQNSTPVGTTVADFRGKWFFTNLTLVEGTNLMSAAAFDTLGAANSNLRNIVRDSGPPAALVLNVPAYSQASGLTLGWKFADTGERATRFRVLWHTNNFTTAAQASAQSPLLTSMNYGPPGLTARTYYFAVIGYDDANNPSPISNVLPYSYDPLSPSFAINFDKGAPVGVGSLRIIVTSSKPLASVPSLSLKPANNSPVSLLITNTAFNTYEGTLNVTPSFPSGPLQFAVSGQDLVGNTFNGAPVGPGMAIDVAPPTGWVASIPSAPLQATNATNITISLTLSEAVKPGTVPTLSFGPPIGAAVPIPLSGSSSNWSGILQLLPSMGSGYGTFSLTATDALDNVGHLITKGSPLEIYNTALPSAPGQPVNFQWSSLASGRVQLSWNAVSNAELYRVYSELGTNLFVTPTNLVADNITSNAFIDLPTADGRYRYVVTAVRRGAEGTNSIVRVATSDRTPPPTPLNVSVQLLANGVQLRWQAGVGETPSYFRVYRNGAQIATVSATATNITDSPPRGIMSYVVAAGDSLGNEAQSAPAAIELLVGAVNNLVAFVTPGQAPTVSWISSDNTAVGFNFYRNGVKQNSTPLVSPTYTDNLGVPAGAAAVYAVRAVNATNAESAPRTVTVMDAAIGFRNNLQAGVENSPVTFWFDRLKVSVTNRSTGVELPLSTVVVSRSLSGSGYVTRSANVQTAIGSGDYYETDIVFPAGTNNGPLNVRVQAVQQTDLAGSSVIYQRFLNYDSVTPLGAIVDVASAQQPLAGGLATFTVTLFNRGYADMDVLVTQNGGSDPGDIALSVIDRFGQEVGRTQYKGTPPGTFFTTDGRGFLRIAPGDSKSVTVPNVLVPDALGTNVTRFLATVPRIYYRLGSADEAVAGPLSGSMESSLALTPYYGVAVTDKALYANDSVVHITGQAIDRQSGLPKANAPLKIGFFTRGCQFYYAVNTDNAGNFSYDWSPTPGLSGTFNIWAAHPDVFDVLNQAQFKLYRCYLSPSQPELRMSKNDTINFTITLVNPGDENLTDFSLASQSYQLVGTNRTPIATVTATSLSVTNFGIAPRSSQKVSFQMQATLDAPDNAVVELRFSSSEGATATCSVNLALLPANPLLAVVDPPVGYAEVSVNRGNIASRTVTVVNRGLRPLQGVTLQPPTNINWMSLNLPLSAEGVVHLPDLAVGASNVFTAVFAPPTNAPLEYLSDFVTIRGTNTPAAFKVNMYALVTSSQKGKVQFTVDDILVQPVPNATIRIKNTILEQEYTLKTDANGQAEIDDLQEGQWAWQVSAAGHGANVGVVEVIPNQVVGVDTRLSRSLVTVSFTVTPVPFTDRYEITIEQTFQTHVPAPVLIFKPSLMDFKRIQAGFDATFIATLKNEGLIEAVDVQIVGSVIPQGRLTPLINYFPKLAAQQIVEVPMHFQYWGYNVATNSSGPGLSSPCGRKRCFGYDIDADGNITPQPGLAILQNYNDFNQYPCTGGAFDLEHLLGALNAIADACAICADLRTAMHLVTGLVTHFEDHVVSDITSTISTAAQVVDTLGALFGCPGGGGGPGGGGSGPGSGGGSAPGRGFSSYTGGGAGCFVAGTEILMADGTVKPIEEVRVDDLVRTGTGASDVSQVAETIVRTVPTVQTVEFAPALGLSATGRQRAGLVQTTSEHEFWVDGKGWTAVAQLKSGDWLLDADGEHLLVRSVTSVSGPTRVYTMSNQKDHAFYANNVLVRDSCGDRSPLASGKSQQQPSLPLLEVVR